MSGETVNFRDGLQINMTKTSSTAARFKLIGKLSKISDQQKKIKYLKLTTETGKYWIKIPRQLRKQLASLSLGCQLEVQGKVKQGQKTGKTKYKAQMVVIIAPETLNTQSDTKKNSDKSISLPSALNGKSRSKLQAKFKAKAKSKVLICHKSNCWKKGGQKVCAAIESILEDHNLTKEISIKQTGCLKQCKKAPALVMMPDKASYQNVRPKQVREIVEKHLIASNY